MLADLSPFLCVSNNSTRGALNRKKSKRTNGNNQVERMFALISFFLSFFSLCVMCISVLFELYTIYVCYIRNVWLVHNLIGRPISRKIAKLMHHLRTSTPQFCRLYIRITTMANDWYCAYIIFAHPNRPNTKPNSNKRKQFLCGHVSVNSQ